MGMSRRGRPLRPSGCRDSVVRAHSRLFTDLACTRFPDDSRDADVAFSLGAGARAGEGCVNVKQARCYSYLPKKGCSTRHEKQLYSSLCTGKCLVVGSRVLTCVFVQEEYANLRVCGVARAASFGAPRSVAVMLSQQTE